MKLLGFLGEYGFRILLSLALFAIAFGMSILSAKFNYEGGYLLGKMLSADFATSVAQGMVAVEVVIFFSYAVFTYLQVGFFGRLLTTSVISGLSIFCLTFLMYSGINTRGIDSESVSLGDQSTVDEIKNIEADIVLLREKIESRETRIKQAKLGLSKSSVSVQQLVADIEREKKAIGGVSCPSKKYRSRCKKIMLGEQKLADITIGVSSADIQKLRDEIEDYKEKITNKGHLKTDLSRQQTHLSKNIQKEAGLANLKPDMMDLAQFALVCGLIFGVSMEIIKSLPISWFWKIFLNSREKQEKTHLDSPESFHLGFTWGRIGEFINPMNVVLRRAEQKRKLKLVEAEIKAKEIARLEFQEKSDDKKKDQLRDASIFDVTNWLLNITVPQLKAVCETSLEKRRKRTKIDEFATAVCLTFKTSFESKKQVTRDDVLKAIYKQYPEAESVITDYMMQKVFLVLVDDMKFIKKIKGLFYWKSEIEIISARNSMDGGWIDRNMKGRASLKAV